MQTPGPIVHLHVPKCAGRSWATLLRLVFDEQREGSGGEQTLQVTSAERCLAPLHRAGAVHTSLFKSPREHVLSQFVMCAYSTWAAYANHGELWSWLREQLPMGLTGATKRNRSAGVIGGFSRWLAHFGDSWRPWQGDFSCYNPRSMQARALTCVDGGREGSHHAATVEQPELPLAVASLQRLQHVGLAELIPESWCLLHFAVTSRLPHHCGSCETFVAAAARAEHGDERLGGPRVVSEELPPHSVSALPVEVVRAIDAITAVDAGLYRAAVARFLADATRVQRLTRARFLCPARLGAFEARVAYLIKGTNLTQELKEAAHWSSPTAPLAAAEAADARSDEVDQRRERWLARAMPPAPPPLPDGWWVVVRSAVCETSSSLDIQAMYSSTSSVHANTNGAVNCWWLDRVTLEQQGRSCSEFHVLMGGVSYSPCMPNPSVSTRCYLDSSVAYDCFFSPSTPRSCAWRGGRVDLQTLPPPHSCGSLAGGGAGGSGSGVGSVLSSSPTGAHVPPPCDSGYESHPDGVVRCVGTCAVVAFAGGVGTLAFAESGAAGEAMGCPPKHFNCKAAELVPWGPECPRRMGETYESI